MKMRHYRRYSPLQNCYKLTEEETLLKNPIPCLMLCLIPRFDTLPDRLVRCLTVVR